MLKNTSKSIISGEEIEEFRGKERILEDLPF
jgi:hypothetical protein